jgi:hypothetical protein
MKTTYVQNLNVDWQFDFGHLIQDFADMSFRDLQANVAIIVNDCIEKFANFDSQINVVNILEQKVEVVEHLFLVLWVIATKL